MSADNQGSFLTGFSLGLFAGAAGFFLFATQDGRKTQKRLAAEWAQAKDKLAAEGLIEDPEASFKELLLTWFEDSSKTQKPLGKKKRSEKKKIKTAAKKLKFKGV
ncbi:MAG: hypothetical protein GF390_01550 [Candidatus Pacebacteria bacterium]|nr:hypothetical protein [Candidatus Paceibacterota bacterium]